MSSMHPLLGVVTESEEVTVNQVPEEENPPVEVGLIYVVHQKNLIPLLTKASLGAYSPFLVVYKCFII